MPHPGWHDFRFDGIGTAWEISTRAPLDSAQRHSVLAEVERYDATWSRFRRDSLVSQMSARAGQHELPAESEALADLYRELYTLSRGAMTPLIGAIMSSAALTDSTVAISLPAVTVVPSSGKSI